MWSVQGADISCGPSGPSCLLAQALGETPLPLPPAALHGATPGPPLSYFLAGLASRDVGKLQGVTPVQSVCSVDVLSQGHPQLLLCSCFEKGSPQKYSPNNWVSSADACWGRRVGALRPLLVTRMRQGWEHSLPDLPSHPHSWPWPPPLPATD